MAFTDATKSQRLQRVNEWDSWLATILANDPGMSTSKLLQECQIIIKDIILKPEYIYSLTSNQWTLLENSYSNASAYYNTGFDQVEDFRLNLEQFSKKQKSFAGYQEKRNQLNQLEAKIETIIKLQENGKLESFINIIQNIDILVSEFQEKNRTLQIESASMSNNVQAALNTASALNSQCQSIANTLQALQETQSAEWQSFITSTKKTINKVEESIEEELANYKIELEDFKTSVEETITHNENTNIYRATLIKELEALKIKVRKELENALDISTFHEFESVTNKKEKNSLLWLWAGVALTFLVFGMKVIFFLNFGLSNITINTLTQEKINSLGTMFLSSAIVCLPLLFLIWFCFQRYTREQRLTEEYRFKSTCALHFNTYTELVQEICKNEIDTEYRTFLIDQINRLFQSPIDKIYKDSNIKKNEFAQLTDLLGVVAPPLEKVINIVKKLESKAEEKP